MTNVEKLKNHFGKKKNLKITTAQEGMFSSFIELRTIEGRDIGIRIYASKLEIGGGWDFVTIRLTENMPYTKIDKSIRFIQTLN